MSAYAIIKLMSRLKKTDITGFTIIEEMIVLAVTTIIFFMSTVFIQGKEAYNQFVVAINNVEAQLNGDINDVQNGSYIFPNNTSCSEGNNSNPIVNYSSNLSSQGTNKGCIFVGDAIKFDSNKFNNYPIVGNQFQNATNINSQPTYGILDSKPILISGPNPVIQYFENGLTLYCANYSINKQNCDSSSLQNLGGIIIGINGSNNQQLETNISPDIDTLQLSDSNFVGNTNNTLNGFNSSFILSSQNINLCFSAGGINDSAEFTIGSNNSSYVGYKIYYGSKNCQ